MNQAYLESHYNELLKQRRQYLLLLAGLLLVLVLSISSNIYQLTSNRVILVPAGLKQEFAVAGNQISAKGLEQHGLYFAHLYLNFSPETINTQHGILLEHVHPDFYNQFKSQLKEMQVELQRIGIASHFFVENITTSVKQQSVTLTGKLKYSQGPASQPGLKKKFEIKFKPQFGKTYIIAFKEIHEK